jgi:hypothetical protein
VTAYAHGEMRGTERRRARAHVEGCPACAAEVREAARLLGALRTMDPRRTLLARLSPSLALAAAGLALLLGAEPRLVAPPQSSADAVVALLAAQAPDGRWPAHGAPPGRETSSTAAAVIALLQEGGTDGSGARDEVRARALADGARWLLAHGAAEADGGWRDEALALAALVEVCRAGTVHETAQVEVGRRLRALARALPSEPPGSPARAWGRRALQRARPLGIAGVSPALARLDATERHAARPVERAALPDAPRVLAWMGAPAR